MRYLFLWGWFFVPCFHNLYARKAWPSTHHQVRSVGGKYFSIRTAFTDVLGGEGIFQDLFNPRVLDRLSHLEGPAPSDATPRVRGFYTMSVAKKDAVGLAAVASSQVMSSAPSLRSVGEQAGQALILTAPGQVSRHGVFHLVFNTAPVNTCGIQVYVGPTGPLASPKIIPVMLLMESGDRVTVYAASLPTKDSFPEKSSSGKQAYGYLTVYSETPFKEIYTGFDNKYLSENNFAMGGNLRFHSTGSLMDVDLPFDQMDTLAYNEAVYSNVALLPLSDHPAGAAQSLGLDCAQALVRVSLRADPRSLMPILFSTDTQHPQDYRCSKIWIKPISMGEKTSTHQMALQGVWMGWRRGIKDRFSIELLGGRTYEDSTWIYNSMRSTSLWAGISLEGRWRTDGGGPRLKQSILFARHHVENTRTLPLFYLEANQAYTGHGVYGFTRLDWPFFLSYGIEMVPYALFSCAADGHPAFEETVLILPKATPRNRWMAENAALQFKAYTKIILLQEAGVTVKKRGYFKGKAWDVWFSAAVGSMQWHSKTPLEVGFVDFLNSYTLDFLPNRSAYYAPMVGVQWHFSENWILSVGGRYQNSIFLSRDISDDRQDNWSTWFSIARSF